MIGTPMFDVLQRLAPSYPQKREEARLYVELTFFPVVNTKEYIDKIPHKVIMNAFKKDVDQAYDSAPTEIQNQYLNLEDGVLCQRFFEAFVSLYQRPDRGVYYEELHAKFKNALIDYYALK